MENKDFTIFILTFGRPNNVKTYKTLNRFGYTGTKYLICSTDDKKLNDYKQKYKDEVLVFDKDKVKQDIGDNFKQQNTVLYARNIAFDLAKELGYTYFLVLDDDYTDFSYRFDDKYVYKTGRAYIKNLDKILDALLDYYKSINAKTIAISQNGDWIGGSENNYARQLKLRRKAMNSFFCSTERPFKYIGRMNDDVNTYVKLGSVGDLFLTLMNVSLKQTDTQSNTGGLTEMYLNAGTYTKSFYTVMYSPDCAKISVLNTNNSRIHHKINWNNAVPCLISENYKK